MSSKVPDTPKRPRRLKKPIEPIHVEELLAGAGMSGFLGVLEHAAPAACPPTTPARHATSEISARVASVVGKVEALNELMQAAANKKK